MNPAWEAAIAVANEQALLQSILQDLDDKKAPKS